MKNLKHVGILYIAIGLLLSTIFIMRCSGDKQKDKIIIPEKNGELEDLHPKEVMRDSIFVYKLRDTIIKYNRPLDTIYITEYLKSDPIIRTEKYIEAVAKRTYTNVIEDSLLRLNYTAQTEGKLLDLKVDYKIKSSIVEHPKPKESVFTLYGGAGLKTTTDLNSLTPVGMIGIQNKKGTIIYAQYGSDKSVQVGAMIKVFDIKK